MSDHKYAYPSAPPGLPNERGITIREHFAAMFVPVYRRNNPNIGEAEVARQAVAQADALIAELAK